MQYKPKKIDYTSPASAQGGPGVQKQITHYFGTSLCQHDSPPSWAGVAASIGASIGDIWWLGGGAKANGGNAFMFVKSKSTLALGQVVAARSPTVTVDDAGGAAATAVTGAGNAVSPTTTTAICTTNINNVAWAAALGGGVNEDVDNWLYIDSVQGAVLGLPQMRRIKANSSSASAFYTVSLRDPLRPNSPLDQDVFDTVPLTAEPASIIRPYHVQLCTNVLTPVGIALGTVTAGNYTVIQVAGLAAVSATNTGAATVVNVPAVVQAGSTITGAGGTANLYNGASAIIPQLAYNGAPAVLIPCYVNFTGQ